MELIQRTTLTLAASAINFPSIPQSYQDLFLTFKARGDDVGANVTGQLTINGNTTTIYEWTRLYGTSGAAGSVSAGTQTYIYAFLAPAAGGIAGRWSAGTIWIPDYLNPTNGDVTVVSDFGIVQQRESDSGSANVGIGAVSSITIAPSSGNWVAGTTMSLYGIS